MDVLVPVATALPSGGLAVLFPGRRDEALGFVGLAGFEVTAEGPVGCPESYFSLGDHRANRQYADWVQNTFPAGSSPRLTAD